jgi:hypothetical protein
MAAITTGEPRTGPARGRLPLTAGRRAALVVGVPVCLLLVAATGLNLVASFGQGNFAVRYTAPAGTRSLTVSSPGGPLRVSGAAAGTAGSVAGTADYSLVRSKVTTSSAGGAAVLRYQCPMPVGNCALNATVSAPASLPVTVSNGGGMTYVVGTAGTVTASVGGGDISALDTSGPLSLHTFGGNVIAGGTRSAAVTVTSGGGDVYLTFTRVPRDVRVQTSGGDITIVLPATPAGYHVTPHTDGGNVTDMVGQEDSSPNVVTASTGGGNIVIRQQ